MFKSIVVGTDGSDTAAEAVRVAVGLAQQFDARLHVVRAYRPVSLSLAVAAVPEAVVGLGEADSAVREDVEAFLDQLARDIGQRGVSAETYACPQGAAQALLQVAEASGADLVVVGNRGMQGARRVLGSVPNTITHHAPCAVLVVRTCDR